MTENKTPAKIKQPYKIGIDCRLSGRKHAGIGRYVSNLVEQLLLINTNGKIEWYLFFSDREQAQEVLPSGAVAHIIFCPVRHYTIEEQLKMPAIFGRYELDLLHVPHFNIPLLYQGKIVVTIHDLLWHEYQGTSVTTLPSWQYKLKHLAYRYTVGQAIKKAEQIIVPTNTVKATIQKYYPTEIEKITVSKEGVDPLFFNESISSENTREKKLVYVGSLYPHKNIEVVLQTLKQLPDYSLVLVGARNVFQDQIRKRIEELQIENQVKFAGYLNDEDLLELFSTCTALVQPSLFEGFGLTGVEAMANRLPVLASDIPVFKEIYQDAALYFDPTSVGDLIQQIDKLEQPSTVKHLVKMGIHVSQQYRWDTMAEQTLGIYLKQLQ